MIRKGTQKEVDDYFAEQAVSQSFLKNLLRGVEYLEKDEKKLYYDEKGHFIIGSATDIKLTQEEADFESAFYCFKGIKPSDTIMSMVQYVFDMAHFDETPPDDNLEYYSDLVLESAILHNYQARWNDQTKIDKIIAEGSNYFKELQLSKGKQILSLPELTVCDNIVMSFKTHPFTRVYFQYAELSNVDIFYQVPIYFNYMDVDCKALLDMVIINRNDKSIQPIDFKTMSGSTKSFPYSSRRFRYDIQGAFYSIALEELANGFQNANSPIKEIGDIKGYSIDPFMFMVETTDYSENKMTGDISYAQGRPLIFTMSADTLKQGYLGRPELTVFAGATDPIAIIYPIKYDKIAGFTDLINLYLWYEKNGYAFDRDIAENNGDLIF